MSCRAGLEKSVACVGIPTTFPGTSVLCVCVCAGFFVISEIFVHVLVSGFVILKCALKVWADFHLTCVLVRSANEPAGSLLTTSPYLQSRSEEVRWVELVSCPVWFCVAQRGD